MDNIYLQGPGGITMPLPEGHSTIGRESSNQIHLDDAAASRQHARLSREANQVWLTDLNSANGTFVNDHRLQANQLYPLNSGDRISIGGRVNYTIYGASPAANASNVAGTVLLPDPPPYPAQNPPAQYLPVQYPPAYSPPPAPQYPAHPPQYAPAPQASVKPGKVQAIAIMNLIDGILNILWGIGLTCSAITTIIGILFIPITIYPIVLGILELVYASQLMANPPTVTKPAQYLAIMQILNILLAEPISLIIGIISLIFYSDNEVQAYFNNLRAGHPN